MFGGIKRESVVTDSDMEEDYYKFTASWNGSGSDKVKVELPPPFRGDGQKPFATWIKQFEAAVRAQTRGASGRSYTATLVNILPTRLDGAAFLLWDSLPADVQCDYERMKEKLKEAFGQKQFLLYFQSCVSARPRQVNESLEVYAADISRLVAEAFPEYDRAARDGEKFRRFLAGLDPALQAKCHEQGASDMEEALMVASRCERARLALMASVPGSPYSPPQPAVVATLGSPPATVADGNAKATEKLMHVVERLTVEMGNLQTEMRDMRARSRGTEYGRRSSPFSREQHLHDPGARGEHRRACRCDCGELGCRSTTGGYQRDDRMRGRSPQRRQQGGYGAREWSPRERGTSDTAADFSPRRRDSEVPREPHTAEERQSRRGVRFLSPSRRSPSPSPIGQDRGNFR